MRLDEARSAHHRARIPRILGLPAFWIISLLIPLIVAVVPLAQNLFSKSQTVGYVLVDNRDGMRRRSISAWTSTTSGRF